ncbi:hypothetical protein L5M38_11455 [Shewanella sp. SM101]|uniref:hypothetical protein n=1 Tax=Shewanella sp. SM21 TaxID=2912793 RepID=UPI0021DB70E3|nr:hypothetical protein [Shewanella sp. SM21]MCU8089970.1 hypothetical protein [Shewanella sp. SM21]MCU8105151.1 hypothetical protein [Shewanella sp. SM101]
MNTATVPLLEPTATVIGLMPLLWQKLNKSESKVVGGVWSTAQLPRYSASPVMGHTEELTS